ncbi:MAG: hypothetical protein ACOCXM_09120 [Myxococcota bacterium]
MALPSALVDGLVLAAVIHDDRLLQRAGPHLDAGLVRAARVRLERLDASGADGRTSALRNLARALRPASPRADAATRAIGDPGLRETLQRIAMRGDPLACAERELRELEATASPEPEGEPWAV